MNAVIFYDDISLLINYHIMGLNKNIFACVSDTINDILNNKQAILKFLAKKNVCIGIIDVISVLSIFFSEVKQN